MSFVHLKDAVGRADDSRSRGHLTATARVFFKLVAESGKIKRNKMIWKWGFREAEEKRAREKRPQLKFP